MASLKWFAAVALTALAAGFGRADAAEVKEINFVEAVHNLGYINLYVGQHAGIFEKNGLKLKVSAAGGDTQAFAAVLGKSSPFAIGDATMVQMSREAGGPGIVVGTVIQRAHYFGVSKNLSPLTDAKQFKGLTVVTSPDPNTNFSVTKKLLLDNGLKPQVDTKILEVNPGTEIGAMLAGQADMAVAYQPSVAAAESQGAKIVFDFAKYVGPFCNTGIMVLPDYAKANPDIVQALVKSFEEAGRLVYSDPAYAKKVARLEFPDIPGDVVDKAIDAEVQFKIPAETVVTQVEAWNNLMAMQKFLGNVKYSIPMDQVIDNSYAEKAVKAAENVKAPK
jgi:NitT/TauT family transport system substrate-binding protein